MRDSTQTRQRRWLETGLLATGFLLLSLFAAITAWNRFQSQSAIGAFEEAKAASMEAAAGPVKLAIAPESRADPIAETTTAPVVFSFDAGQPDVTTWSEKRIAEYRDSLLAADDDPQALLTIDRLNIRVPVYNGADDLNLNRGVARIKGTGRFDLGGNLGIAGHRDGFFRPLKDIEVGDTMTLETLDGVTEFVVASITIVDPTEVSVLAPTDTPSVTLVTCYPFYFVGHAPQRFIVRGEIKSQTVTS